jgi:hypothetical protein
MNKRQVFSMRWIIGAFWGIIVIYLLLVTYLCATTKIAYLITDTVKSGFTIVPSAVAETFLFNFRGGKADINELKTEDGGLNYIVSTLDASTFSEKKKQKYLKFFILRGCGVNALCPANGLRPLHIAAIDGKADVVELLLNNGANPLLKADSSSISGSITPLEAVEKLNNKNPSADYTKVVEILRKAEDKSRRPMRPIN